MNTSPSLPSRVVVIGGGLAGLASACTLAARGYAVTLVEKNPWLGGKAAQLRGEAPDGSGAFRFDMGPTILTMPKVLRRVFEEAGRNLDDYLDLRRLDPQWRCFFDASTSQPGKVDTLNLHENAADMRSELQAFCNGEAEASASGYERFLKHADRLADISDRFFFWKSIESIRDMMDPKSTFDLATLKDVLAMKMGRSVASTIRGYVPDKRVAQMLDHFVQYVGSSPYGSPAILCSIASMQTEEGVWYPIGGTRSVPEALTKLGEELGVEFRTGVGVRKIHTETGERGKRRVTAVELDDEELLPAAAVVSNMDSVRTYRELIGGEPARAFEGRRGYEPACSGVVLYLGLNQTYEHLAHHGFVFSRDPEEEFEYIYKKGEPAPDPTCYLAATSKTEAPGEVAPPGGEALYVLVHTPFLRPHHDWSRDGELFQSYRQTILDKLKRTGGMPDLEDRIVFEKALTPQDIHDRYRVLNGAIYGLASHGKFFGAFKPGNRRRDIDGLYLAGGAAHPGPGMPMVLMSGWIAADSLDQDGDTPRRERDPHADASANAEAEVATA
jgi:diapolycopene oxygenase